jgi:hypothetical protein
MYAWLYIGASSVPMSDKHEMFLFASLDPPQNRLVVSVDATARGAFEGHATRLGL